MGQLLYLESRHEDATFLTEGEGKRAASGRTC